MNSSITGLDSYNDFAVSAAREAGTKVTNIKEKTRKLEILLLLPQIQFYIKK